MQSRETFRRYPLCLSRKSEEAVCKNCLLGAMLSCGSAPCAGECFFRLAFRPCLSMGFRRPGRPGGPFGGGCFESRKGPYDSRFPSWNIFRKKRQAAQRNTAVCNLPLFEVFAGIRGADFFLRPSSAGAGKARLVRNVRPGCAKICALDGPAGGKAALAARTAGRGGPALAARPACLCSFVCPMLFRDVLPFPRMPGASRPDRPPEGGKKTAPSPAGGRPHGGTGRQVSGGGAYCAWLCRGGNCTVMAVPTPTWLSSESCAPMPAAMCLTMARPRPVPPVSFERLLSTR